MKKVSVTVKDALEAVPVLKKIFESEDIQSLKLKFRLNTIVDSVDRIGVQYKEAMKRLMETFGEKNEEGEYTIPKDHMEDFVTERDEFINEKEQVEFSPLPLSLLEKDGVTKDLTPREVRVLMPFIEDDTE